MESLEQRIQRVEDRLDLQQLIHTYCESIDNSRLDDVVNCFSEDADLDLGGLGLPRMRGHDGIRAFFADVFAKMKHNAHYSSNFLIDHIDGNTATCHAYVHAVAKTNEGADVLVYAKHEFFAAKTAKGWKIQRFTEPYLIPQVTDIPDYSRK